MKLLIGVPTSRLALYVYTHMRSQAVLMDHCPLWATPVFVLQITVGLRLAAKGQEGCRGMRLCLNVLLPIEECLLSSPGLSSILWICVCDEGLGSQLPVWLNSLRPAGAPGLCTPQITHHLILPQAP